MKKQQKRAPVLASVCVGLAVALLLGSWPSRRPNVVLVVVDTLRADAVSLELGNQRTPALASFAAEGVPFSQAFAHAPMTLPAHAALFSGRHPSEAGVLNNGQRVRADLPLLAERLRDEGYQTRAVLSLATLWPEFEGGGLVRGFQAYDQGDVEVSPAAETTPRLESALETIDPNEPFFLFAHYSDPHEPYNAADETRRDAVVLLDGAPCATVSTCPMAYWERPLTVGPGEHELEFHSEDAFKLRRLSLSADGREQDFELVEGALLTSGERIRARFSNLSDGEQTLSVRAWLNDVPAREEIRERYRDEVSRADAAIGRLLESLKRRGLYENTLVIVTSDHGESLGEHGTIGHVENLYDELLHVPLILRLPRGRIDSRLVAAREDLVRHIDLAPTLLEELGLDELPSPSGSSLFSRRSRTLLAETHPPEAQRTLFCARDDQYKLIFAPDTDEFELFRLGPDPLELDNVFAHQGHLRETWQHVLRKLSRETTSDQTRAESTRAKLSALGY